MERRFNISENLLETVQQVMHEKNPCLACSCYEQAENIDSSDRSRSRNYMSECPIHNHHMDGTWENNCPNYSP